MISIKKSNQINIGPHEMRGNKACATRAKTISPFLCIRTSAISNICSIVITGVVQAMILFDAHAAYPKKTHGTQSITARRDFVHPAANVVDTHMQRLISIG